MPTNIDYTESLELQKLAMKVVEKYQLYLPQVDTHDIMFFEKRGKRSKKSKLCQLCGVGGSWLKHVMEENIKKHYSLEVWADGWGEITENERAWLVLNELYSMDKKHDGKVRKPNIQEFDIFVEFLGPYWRKTPDLLPELMGDDIVPLPMPLDDDEDENSTEDDMSLDS